MTDDKIRSVLDLYEEQLQYIPADVDELHHLRTMLPEMRQFLAEGRHSKLFRWLGFMQGVFYCTGIYSIDEMKDHNREQPVMFECFGEQG